MLSLLVATLIGVFITPDGIVIGADTALSNLGGQVASQQKYCITGPRSVATMQGAYSLEDTVTKATVELQNRFKELCAEVGGSMSPMPLRAQAEHIANGLKADLVEFLEQSACGSGRELRVESRRRQSCREWLQRKRSGERRGWYRNRDRSRNESMGGAGASSRAPDVLGRLRCEIPRAGERRHRRADGQRRAHPQSRHTTARSRETRRIVDEASAGTRQPRRRARMFLQAVRLTVTLGPGFGVPQGAVSLPIDIVVIPRDGAIDVQRVTSW
jgi:hypothetical protein